MVFVCSHRYRNDEDDDVDIQSLRIVFEYAIVSDVIADRLNQLFSEK